MYLLDVYGYFAPGITTMFLLGILWKRTTHAGALAAGALTIPLSLLLQVLFRTALLEPNGNRVLDLHRDRHRRQPRDEARTRGAAQGIDLEQRKPAASARPAGKYAVDFEPDALGEPRHRVADRVVRLVSIMEVNRFEGLNPPNRKTNLNASCNILAMPRQLHNQ